MRGKRGKYYFSPFWFLIQKLDHNSGLHAKNQKEISKESLKKRSATKKRRKKKMERKMYKNEQNNERVKGPETTLSRC